MDSTGAAYITLELPDKHVTFEGKFFGAVPKENIAGEVVFQTGVVGYPESLSDPSYCGQILVLTYPLIGSYGVPNDKEKDIYGIPLHVESDKVHVKCLVVGEYITHPSHHESHKSLHQYLLDHNVTGIEGIDTRRVTQLIRDHGTLKGVIHQSRGVVKFPDAAPSTKGLAYQVCSSQIRVINEKARHRILVVDCGIKNNQLRMLLTDPLTGKDRNTSLFVVGVEHFDRDPLSRVFVRLGCDQVFISNGPGDPRDCDIFVGQLRDFMAKYPRVPIMGICLGHQLMGLAANFDVCKLKYGNRGHNQPCKLVGTTKTFQTTQNHGYAVVYKPSTEWKELFVNLNDGSNEGLQHTTNPWFSVQFHPEAKAGPEDTAPLFDVFLGPVKMEEDGDARPLTMQQWIESFPAKVTRPRRSKVLVLGSGGLCIGQSGEFDYSGSQAIKAFREEGLVVVLVNPNIATNQTTPGFVDRVYFLPVTPEYVEKVIEIERPDCIALSFGGQTALNCGTRLKLSGILEKYGVDVLGTPVEAIIITEDRQAFKKHIQSIGERIPDGAIAMNVEDAVRLTREIGYPVLVRAAFTLGGQGSGFAGNEEELRNLLQVSFSSSDQVIIDKSFRGWKELEYEIVRDRYGNCLSVCNMENLDPLGVHTGESIVVAPSQTLSDEDYNRLRSTALKTVASLGVIGECNIQYALDPKSNDYYIIEINARLSRSSALASKATGYPLAYVAAKLGLGYGLDELTNSITGTTTACFEPSLDYCVVKVPRWDLNKFQHVNTHIGSAMKSVGEGMAISRSFEEALQSAIRMTGMNRYGLQPGIVECTDDELRNPTYRRILAVTSGLWSGAYTVDQIYELSGIDRWFLEKINNIVKMIHTLEGQQSVGVEQHSLKNRRSMMLKAKKLGFSDAAIAHYVGSTELVIRAERLKFNICPDVKQIDTVAAEFPCKTNYLYTTYATNPSVAAAPAVNPNKIIVIGSGVYQIGSSVEFDWCAVNCIRTLRNHGKEVVMINCNPETVSTDYDEADYLYFSEISLETVMDIQSVEQAAGVIVSVGGQLPNNIAMGLHLQGIKIIGTSAESIDCAENRKKFSRMLDRGGIDQPEWKELESVDAAIDWSKTRFPVLVRPSYVLSGAAMNVAYSPQDLRKFLGAAVAVSRDHPVVISKFINDAKEIEVDAVAELGIVKLMAISEHVENAGVHSGDATLIFPSQDVTAATSAQITHIVHYIAKTLEINGPFNIQFIAKDDQVKVIECNLRVSRSFPFVSKTLGVNFIESATQIMAGLATPSASSQLAIVSNPKRIGVKVAQFSFNRLTGAEILLGVEMQSTGEVACFGSDHRMAYLKALTASGFVLPPSGSAILLSIGGHAFKKEFKPAVEQLKRLNYKLYATRNTASYYEINEMRMQSKTTDDNIMSWITSHKFALVINVTERNKMRCVEDTSTPGYQLRQAATSSNIPVVTDIKAAKLLVGSLVKLGSGRLVDQITTDVDCFTAYNTVRIPGLIDVHVHVREPGETHKEDWDTCTAAALAGGVTMLCAMPNTKPSLLGAAEYDLVDRLAQSKARCDYALFAGASSANAATVHSLAPKCAGLKMYLNNTHGDLLLANTMDWAEHIKNWTHPDHPICVHAEGHTMSAVLHIANLYHRRIHVCHVARKEEIELIRLSKEAGMQVTCEVAPHHLFLVANDDKMSSVKPPLQALIDQQALWNNLDIIDCFATDHAPHLVGEKQEHGCCPGFPGLETALGLLLTAVHEKRLTLEDIVLRYHTNPKRIFRLPDQPNTYVEIDLTQRYQIPAEPQMSKAKWTPFAGRECVGAVKRVVLRGETVYISDKPNQGLLVRPTIPVQNVRLGASTVVASTVSEIAPAATKITKRYTEASFDRNVLSADQFTKDGLRMLFERADDLRHQDQLGQLPQLMVNKMLGLFFFEPSTRTRTSFEAAMKRMGGNVINVNADQSSVKKGESLEDSITSFQVCGQVDAIVLRHPEKGSSHRAARVADVPIINGGDGRGEHPTQTLIDLYTIRRELGSVGGIYVVFIGDLRYGRTVHSLAKALALRENVRIHYVSPKELTIPRKIYQYVAERGIEQHESVELTDEVLAVADVLYVTRIQRERHDETLKATLALDPYCITPGVLAKTKPGLRVLHPLPRGTEISTEIDHDPRAAYKRQMENGPYVRMALLSLLIKK